ncbi:MAG: peptidase domain-containing ABC transporter [Chitinophagales bacterium]
MANIHPIQRFWRLLSRYKKDLRHIYTYAVFIGMINLSLPLGIQAIVVYIQTGEFSSSWLVLVTFVLMGIAIAGFFQVLQIRIVENIQQDIFARSSIEFAYRLPKMQLLELDNVHEPELVNRFFDVLTIQKGLPKILIDFSLASFQIVFGLVLLSIYSPYFIILGLLLFSLIWFLIKITGARGLDASIKESKYKYHLVYWLEEIARTNKSFKLKAASQFHLKKTDEITANYLYAREKHFSILVSQFKYFISFQVLIAAGLLLLGGMLVFQGQMNLGQFVAAEIVIILLINSVEKVIRIIDTIYDVLTALEKIGYVTDVPLDNNKGINEIDNSKSAISLELINIGFRYPYMKQYIFQNFSALIAANERVVISGESGTGKSTLLHLMSGIYNLQKGEILLNDIPLQHYKREKLYEQIGVYFPTNQLFAGTIRENIAVGRNISDKAIIEVNKILGLQKYVQLQENGLHTDITSGGRKLPRKIIQKILLARIIIGKPRLLLMEDPLLFFEENETEKIINYLIDKKRNWTLIVVTNNAYWKEKSTRIIEL